jgi:hypothetical protein
MENEMLKKAILITLGLFLMHCGSSGKGPAGGAHVAQPINSAFLEASRKNGIPMDVLKAVAFYETGLNAKASSAPYFQLGEDSSANLLNLHSADTAFGLSQAELGIDPSDQATIPVQIHAYAEWIATHTKDLQLPNAIRKDDDVFLWLWAMAKLHRPGDEAREVVWPLWVRGVMAKMNTGALWQSPSEKVELPARGTPLRVEKLPPESASYLLNEIGFGISDLPGVATRLGLVDIDPSRQTPKKIVITHCPLNITSCIDLQVSDQPKGVYLGAHFIIPQESSDPIEDAIPYQVNDLERPVRVTNSFGVAEYLQDTVVIMLAGQSGHYVEGVREYVNPTWYSAKQLNQMSLVVKSVCKLLTRKYPGEVNENQCRANEGANSLRFIHQGERPNFRFGDIPDFDTKIFTSFLNTAIGSILTMSEIKFVANRNQFSSSESVEIQVSVGSEIDYISVERAVRCPNQSIAWETYSNEPTKPNERSRRYSLRVADAGPNANGEHFLRVLLYSGRSGTAVLSSWGLKSFYLKDYNDRYMPPAKACYRGQ